MKRRRVLAGALLLSLLLSGCWSRLEVNDLGMVVTLGIDRLENGMLDVSMSLALPGAATSGKVQPSANRKPRVILRRQGRTISEAIRQVELSAPRRIRLDHAQVILLGERFGEQGLNHLLDFLMRSPQIRLHSRVLMVRGTTPDALMSADPLMRTTQSEAIRELETGHAGLMVKLKDFFIARAHPHITPVLSTVQLRPHPTGETGAPGQEVELAGAVLLQNDRVVLELDAAETRTLAWLIGDPRDTVVTAACPGSGGGYISAQVKRAFRKTEPSWDGRRFVFRVSVGGDANLTDVQCPGMALDAGTLPVVQQALQRSLSERLNQVVQKTRENRLDPFKFGELVRAKLPAQWARLGGERWLQTWSDNAAVVLESQLQVVHVSMTTESPNMIRQAD